MPFVSVNSNPEVSCISKILGSGDIETEAETKRSGLCVVGDNRQLMIQYLPINFYIYKHDSFNIVHGGYVPPAVEHDTVFVVQYKDQIYNIPKWGDTKTQEQVLAKVFVHLNKIEKVVVSEYKTKIVF
jgi:hypothetical protein